MKKIAYLIQAYTDNIAFKKLVKELLLMENCEVFVHLDKKSKIEDFNIEDKRIHFIENREFVSWAGYAQGKLIFNLIDYVVKYTEKFEYYCFLSESDFPVYNNSNLIEKLEKSKMILLNCSKVQPRKIEKYWFYDFNIASPKLNKIVNKLINTFFEVLYRTKILKKKNQVRINNEMVDVYVSSPFWCLKREVVEYIDKVFKINKDFEKYFKTSFASCELMVSTIVANSQYKEECVFTEKYINLNHLSDICYFCYEGPRVNVLDEKKYEEIIKSKKPFIRKVKYGISDKLIELIKENWS